MIGRYPKAEKYISDLLQGLCPSAQIEILPNNSSPGIINYRLEFGSDRTSKTISFSRDLLDDLEEAFKRNGTSTHDEALKSRAQFTAFIGLGKSGLLPRDFSISKFIVSERGDWDSALNVSTHYDSKFTKDLLEGLEKLHGYLQKHLIANRDLDKGLEPLTRGRDRIAQILKHYKETNSLDGYGVGTETLMYSKAAVLAQIIDKEARKSKAAMTLIREAIEKEIYELVEILREDFLRVPLPQWISEFQESTLADLRGSSHDSSAAGIPHEIMHSLAAFKKDHSDPMKCAFIMMSFGDEPILQTITERVQTFLKEKSFKGLLAENKEYHTDLYWNVLTYAHGCGFGIAVYEQIEGKGFNPNVALEVGYMAALGKKVCILKDQNSSSMHADILGKIYRSFNSSAPTDTIPKALSRWMTDRGFL